MMRHLTGLSSGLVLAMICACPSSAPAQQDAAAAAAAEPPAMLYLAPTGNDAWSGKLPAPNNAKTDGPFATLERARDELRNLRKAGTLPTGPVVVELAGGVYERTAPLALTAEDSGTEPAPVTYRGRKGEVARIVGGKVVTGWQPVTDPAVLARLDESARDKVRQADLRAQGLIDYAEVKAGPGWGQSQPGMELFFQDKPMTVARWPNEGFAHIVDVVGGAPHKIHGIPGDKIGKFTYDGDRPTRWTAEKNVMLHGWWFWDWADQRLRIESVDTEKKVITLDPEPVHSYGFRKGQWYYAYNLLPELDQPGEWYMDRDAGILYFWPPAPLDSGDAMVSVAPALVQMKDVAYLTLHRMTFECSRGTALSLDNVNQVRVTGSVIRNTGGWAASLSGKASGIVGCDLYNMAEGGVSMNGGDRKTLTPAGLYVDNCHFFKFGRWNPICKPGVQVGGVGNRVTHNLFNDAPHMAVMWGGNDHLFEYNEFHSVVYGSNDAGVMYAGYNPAMRGHMIRYNYFHHIYGFEGRGCNGVYLDDMFCSATMFGNIFYQVPRAAFIGGGHDNVVENNVFVDCKPALHVDARMMGWAAASVPTMKQRLEEVPYKEEPWCSRYPQLLTYLEGNYAEPRGNIVTRNICVGGKWDEIEGKAKPGVALTDNLVDEDPKFVDAEHLNFQLRDDSPAWKLGFQRIPIEKIGLYPDDLRVSWPVVCEVRTKPETPAPPAKKALRTAPAVVKVPRLSAPVMIDGTLTPEEWSGLDAAKGIVIEQGLQGEKTSPPSTAWLAWDDTALYVAIDNSINPKTIIRPGNTWGQDDAVELAIRNPAAGKDAPILVLRGFPSGSFVSSDEPGTPAAVVKRVAEGVQYGAKMVDAKRWTTEWRIPFASLGIDPAKDTKFAFNISVRKTADELWLLWQGTDAATWEVGNAGVIELVR
ncbi:MAG: hypothetical protein A3K19_04300 [Lentisphaerae bacterium RIFOXYB12_FULL_65_16]|nr:MAG: hypothetical protein A3K18_09400 [Lentisphaerae bacterium RIFOXYA12_64_32]OGV84304.1 MAG: hypothetical protein A3K19_04300 [Lentisphaerae bacterium RIFOXYB12_FULL_65_16]